MQTGKESRKQSKLMSSFFFFFPIGPLYVKLLSGFLQFMQSGARGPFVMEDTGRNWYLVILLKTVFAFRRPKRLNPVII